MIENQESEAGESTTVIMTPKPKSATRFMTTFKTFCTSRVKAVNDAVKEYQEESLALKQIESLEAIRDKLVE
jgi:NAD(P)H-hydrate repair Nnr-like enzyme with NAD(P)H-hydrate dehydratase domain